MCNPKINVDHRTKHNFVIIMFNMTYNCNKLQCIKLELNSLHFIIIQ
jgi:hypothetical protein